MAEFLRYVKKDAGNNSKMQVSRVQHSLTRLTRLTRLTWPGLLGPFTFAVPVPYCMRVRVRLEVPKTSLVFDVHWELDNFVKQHFTPEVL